MNIFSFSVFFFSRQLKVQLTVRPELTPVVHLLIKCTSVYTLVQILLLLCLPRKTMNIEYEPSHEKTIWISDKVRHKPACIVIEELEA